MGSEVAKRRYALLLRGINVGTKNSLPMAELRALLEDEGCTEVSTYIQSGNVVLTTALAERALTRQVEGALERRLGRPIGTTLRTRSQFEGIVAGSPFEDAAATRRLRCVTFLSEPLSGAAVEMLASADFGDEAYRVSGREIYTWHPQGQGRSALAVALQQLPQPGTITTRNWNTTLKLLELLGPDRGRWARATAG